jgi:molybdopterin-guanine dinucleotide biosynthesis protein A
MQLSAVILAGGQSSRMGRDKAWLHLDGKPLIESALEKVRSLGIEDTFISARAGQDYSSLNCAVLLDSEPGLGPLAGIERALRAAGSKLVLVLPVDLPNMRLEFLRKLVRRCKPLTGAVTELRGNIEPLVAVYPKHCHEYALMSVARGDYSVRNFASACLHEHAVRLVRVSESDAGCFANCNTPQDAERLRAKAW